MTVYVNPYNGSDRVYHTDRTCRHLNDNVRELEKSEAEELGHPVCKECAGTATKGMQGPKLCNQIEGLWADGGEEA